MRKPEKSSKLYHELRKAILLREYQPGAMLPRETELAEAFKVSRFTLRAAMARLENESLVQRIRGKGTYISSGKDKPKITFMLPCPASFHQTSLFLMDIFHGIMEAAHELDCQVETLPLSPSNNPDNIDWAKLLNISRDSKVVVGGFWFSRIFQFLKNSGCRVVLVHDGTYHFREYADLLKNWTTMEKDQYDAAYRVTRKLIALGSRRPHLFCYYTDEKDQPHVRGVQSALRDTGIDIANFTSKMGVCDQINIQSLEKIYKDCRFDSILTESNEILNYFSKYKKIKCFGCFDFQQHNYRNEFPANSINSEFPLRQIGYDAVKELIREDYHPAAYKYKAIIRNNNGNEIQEES